MLSAYVHTQRHILHRVLQDTAQVHVVYKFMLCTCSRYVHVRVHIQLFAHALVLTVIFISRALLINFFLLTVLVGVITDPFNNYIYIKLAGLLK